MEIGKNSLVRALTMSALFLLLVLTFSVPVFAADTDPPQNAPPIAAVEMETENPAQQAIDRAVNGVEAVHSVGQSIIQNVTSFLAPQTDSANLAQEETDVVSDGSDTTSALSEPVSTLTAAFSALEPEAADSDNSSPGLPDLLPTAGLALAGAAVIPAVTAIAALPALGIAAMTPAIVGTGVAITAAAGLGLAGLAAVTVPVAVTGLADAAVAGTALAAGGLALGAAAAGTGALITGTVGIATVAGTTLTAGLIAGKLALDVLTADVFTAVAAAAAVTGIAVTLGVLTVGSALAVGTGLLVSALVAGHIFRRIIEFSILALGTAALVTGAVIVGGIALAVGVHFTLSAIRLALFTGAILTSLALIGSTIGLGIMAGIALGVFLSIAGAITAFVVIGTMTSIALAIGTALLIGTALAIGTAIAIGIALAMGTAFLIGTMIAFAIGTAIAFGIALMIGTAIALGTAFAVSAAVGLLFLTGAAFAAMLLFGAVTGFALVAGIIFGMFLLNGIILASLFAFGNIIGLGLLADLVLGTLGVLAMLSLPLVLLAGFLAIRFFVVPIAILTWGNIGRAWGRFVGALIGAAVSFFIAGLLGSIFSLPFLRPAFAVLWQLICVPLWSVLGAFNGALICIPLGMFLGAGIGLLFPVWSLLIGTWLVPMFALLWDSLATTQIVLTTLHLIAGLLGLPIGMLTWDNVGRAWGGFIGSWVGAFVSFILAGALGFLFGLPGLRLAFAWLWQVICVPLWSVLGAFNGAVICGVLGTGLGAILGMTVPLWSILIGSWFVPLFALLWDSLATAEIIGAHLLSVASQWMVRYPLRWARMNAFVFIPGALKSLLNIVLLRYGPLFNHIHKITAFSDSVDSGWGSLGYLLYGKTVVANKPVLDSAPWLVGYVLGAWVNQYSIPGGRTNEIRFLLDPFYLPDYNLRNQMEELSNGSISFWKLLLMKFFARMSVRTSQVVTINIGSNDLWVPIMAALYDIANDGRFGLFTTPERVALFGKWPTMIGNVVHYVLAWYIANALSSYNPTKPYFLLIKLAAGIVKEFTDYYINLPIILMHIFLLNPFATVVVEGTESPVRNWDIFPALDDNLIEYAMEPVYETQNLYKRLLVLLYPGKAVYADMHGIQLKTERFAVPTFENLTLDDSGFDPHPSWIGRRQQADRILRALGQPSPYGWSESVYLRPSVFWNFIYPWRPTTLIHPLWARFRPLDGIHFRPLYSFQTILPTVSNKLLPVQY